MEVQIQKEAQVQRPVELEYEYEDEHDRRGGKYLKVYVDKEKNRYYIDTMAAYALGYITFDVADSLCNRGQHLYEISRQILEALTRKFRNRIIYENIGREKREDPRPYYYDGHIFASDLTHNYNNYKYNDFDNPFENFKDYLDSKGITEYDGLFDNHYDRSR